MYGSYCIRQNTHTYEEYVLYKEACDMVWLTPEKNPTGVIFNNSFHTDRLRETAK